MTGWTQTPYPSTLGGFAYLSGSNISGQPFWDQGTVPGGIATAGFIQVFPGAATDSLTQSLTLVAGSTYAFSYLENARSGRTPLLEVLIGGTPLIASHADSPVGAGNPFRLVTASFVATSSSEVLQFLVAQRNSGDDATALITGVSLNVVSGVGSQGLDVPEPAPMALLGFGLAALMAARGRASWAG